MIRFDFSALKSVPYVIDLDAGASSYWSEIANMQTLDNLLMQGKIPTSEYLRRLPNGQITDRETLINLTRAAERGMMMPMGEVPMQAGTQKGNVLDAAMRGGAGYSALQRKINQTGEIPKR